MSKITEGGEDEAEEEQNPRVVSKIVVVELTLSGMSKITEEA